MENIDFALVLQEIIHSSPMLLGLFLGALHFAKRHQATTEQIQVSMRNIEDKILSADLPKMQKSIDSLQKDFQSHKLEDTRFHTEFVMMLKERIRP